MINSRFCSFVIILVLDISDDDYTVVMGVEKTGVLATWNLFSPEERRNIFIYIGGIMLYKFGLEAFNGSIM